MIYLDNAATTPINDEVLAEMVPYLTSEYGNPGSIYSIGTEAAMAIKLARERVAQVFSCEPENIIFTSGGSEGNNLVINGLRQFLSIANKKHIITSAVEHDSVLHAVSNLSKYDGFIIDYLDVNKECVVSPHDVLRNITNAETHVGLVSIMYVNNETGACNPITTIGDICKTSNVMFHTDCVQAAGMFDLNVKEIGCDFATISSHKINGPKGIGAIYVNDNKNKLVPIISGGNIQEFGYRGGTENVAGIVGFGKACDIMIRNFENNIKKINHLSNYAKDLIRNMIKCARINCQNDGKIISITIPGVDAQSLILSLSDTVAISAGSACSAHSNNPSHVLTAIGLSDEDAYSTIRISISPDIDDNSLLEAITDISVNVRALQCITGL